MTENELLTAVPLYARYPPCACSHAEAIHDLNPKKVRTACSHADGPKNTPCGCKAYVEGAGDG